MRSKSQSDLTFGNPVIDVRVTWILLNEDWYDAAASQNDLRELWPVFLRLCENSSSPVDLALHPIVAQRVDTFSSTSIIRGEVGPFAKRVSQHMDLATKRLVLSRE